MSLLTSPRESFTEDPRVEEQTGEAPSPSRQLPGALPQSKSPASIAPLDAAEPDQNDVEVLPEAILMTAPDQPKEQPKPVFVPINRADLPPNAEVRPMLLLNRILTVAESQL
jgi:hypothetical protein